MSEPWWRRHPRVAFFALGVGLTVVSAASQIFWYDLMNRVFHSGIIYDTRPLWLRALMFVLTWLPLIGLVTVLAARIRRGRAYRPLAYVVGGASVYVVSVATLFAQPMVENYQHEARFDPVVWRQNSRTEALWPVRLTMVDDLLQRGVLIHASRDSVERLLGPRDVTPYFADWDLVYWLGPERGLLRIDSEWLVLNFGPEGRVSSVQIVRD